MANPADQRAVVAVAVWFWQSSPHWLLSDALLARAELEAAWAGVPTPERVAVLKP